MRKNFKALGSGTLEFLYPTNPKIISYTESYNDEVVLVAANLSGRPQHAELSLPKYKDFIPVDALGGTSFPLVTDGTYPLSFGPYGYFIFSLVKKSVSPNVIVRKQIKTINGQKKIAKLFEGKSRYTFELEILPEYLKANRWFGGKGRALDHVKILNVISFVQEKEAGHHFLMIVEVAYNDGLPENYFLPITYSSLDISNQLGPESIISLVREDKNQLGTLYDGVYDDTFRAKLLQLIVKKRTVPGKDCEIAGRWLTHHAGEPDQLNGLSSKVLKADQSNTAIIYGEKLFLKLLRHAEEGKNPEIDIGTVLARHDFVYSTRLLGYAEYKTAETEPADFLILNEFMRNQGDAWTLFTGEFSRFVDNAMANTEFWTKYAEIKPITNLEQIQQPLIELLGVHFVDNVKLLATRTAEFHLTLDAETEDPDFCPEHFSYQYKVSLTQSMTSYETRVFNQMKAATNVNDEVRQGLAALIGMKQKLMSKFNDLKSATVDSIRARIHGDFHLGQVLYTGNDFAIIDFEGEPMRSIGDRRTKRSQIRDIAGMIRSFQYAAYSYMYKTVVLQKDREKDKVEKLVSVWSNAVSRIYLKSYVDRVKGSKILPSDANCFRVLLEAYLLEKAIYEVGYELNNRPEWAIIPLRGVLELLDSAPALNRAEKAELAAGST